MVGNGGLGRTRLFYCSACAEWWETVGIGGERWGTVGNSGKRWETVGNGGERWELSPHHGFPRYPTVD
eukprot:12256216-Alexandrium_andersonii.AAC.1